jgi:hypothetical protein
VMAVMSWFHEHPKFLSIRSMSGGVGKREYKTSGEVAVSSLLEPKAVELNPGDGSDSPGTVSWRRFMELILAAFREPRGPIADEDDAVHDSRTPPADDPADQNRDKPARRGRSFQRLKIFEDLLDRMLSGPVEERSQGFWFAHFVCDRIEIDTVRVKSYLDKVIAAFTDHAPLEADMEPLASAVLVWSAHAPAGADAVRVARITRRKLLRLGANVAGPLPEMKYVQGFMRALAPDFDFPDLWQKIREAKTPQEEIRAFRLAGAGSVSDAEFPFLAGTEELGKITPSERKRIKFMTKYSAYCPCCNLGLPAGQASRLREFGVARASNCCGRILLCEEI